MDTDANKNPYNTITYKMHSTVSNKLCNMFIEDTYIHSNIGSWFFPAIWSSDHQSELWPILISQWGCYSHVARVRFNMKNSLSITTDEFIGYDWVRVFITGLETMMTTNGEQRINSDVLFTVYFHVCLMTYA